MKLNEEAIMRVSKILFTPAAAVILISTGESPLFQAKIRLFRGGSPAVYDNICCKNRKGKSLPPPPPHPRANATGSKLISIKRTDLTR